MSPEATTTPDAAAPLLIDAKTAAAALSIGSRTLWTLTRCEAIPSVRIGRRVLYRPGELAAWLDAGAPHEPGAAERVRRMIAKGVGR